MTSIQFFHSSGSLFCRKISRYQR